MMLESRTHVQPPAPEQERDRAVGVTEQYFDTRV